MLESIKRLQRAINMGTRLNQFLVRHHNERAAAAARGIERSARECWYDEAIRDIELYVIDGNPLPPEDA